MGHIDYKSFMFEEFGATKQNKDAATIWLKKRTQNVIYTPDKNERHPGAMYPHAIVLKHQSEESELKNGTILVSFECYTYKTPVFPIYASEDDGQNWKKISEVQDCESGHGCRYQPHLYELPKAMGKLPKGAILCAGNIIPDDMSSTSLRLYVSTDGAKSWTYLSEIVSGGVAYVDPKDQPDENRPVWEPFLEITEEGKLICFFSDERFAKSKGWNQMLAHKVSDDGGVSWTEEVVDVAYADSTLRPGMPIIAKADNKGYFMVYEMVNKEGIPVYFRHSDSIENWGDCDFTGNLIRCADGFTLSGTPYILWIPQGGEEGTLLVSGRLYGQILANSNAGKGVWEAMPKLIDADTSCGFTGYSQCLLSLHEGRQVMDICPQQISPDLAQIVCAVADVYVKA